jgi:cytochrome c-type biogenesis protein CcmH/NrfF
MKMGEKSPIGLNEVVAIGLGAAALLRIRRRRQREARERAEAERTRQDARTPEQAPPPRA